MPATVNTRGVLKPSQNRVRTSGALQGSAMWENVIGIVNEERGANTQIEALINAPQRGGGGRQAAAARKAAAAEAVLATGAFDTAITNYESLLDLAKAQGAIGSSNRGACRICGQLGHLTKQCRNQFSKFFQEQQTRASDAPPPMHGVHATMLPGDNTTKLHRDDGSDILSSLSNSRDSGSSDASSLSESDSEEERRKRKRKRKEKERRRDESSRARSEKKKRKKEKKHSRRDKDKKRKKRRHRSRSRSPAS